MDEVFLHAKGRSKSVAMRFPNLFGDDSGSKFIVAREATTVIGAVAMRTFKWIVGTDTFSGAMVGFVCTAESARGQGVGASLMARTAEELRRQQSDFGVLWTKHHRFYTRLGWTLSDAAMFGTLPGAHAEPGELAACTPSAKYVELERLRTDFECMRVDRSAKDYQVTPCSAEVVECWSPMQDSIDAYALIGRSGPNAYVYEVVGAAAHFWRIAHNLSVIAPCVHFNSHPHSAFGRWTLQELGHSRERQAQAMWLPLSARVAHIRFDDWYVPFFDRI